MALVEQASPFGPKRHFVGISQALTAVPVDVGAQFVVPPTHPKPQKNAPPFQMTQREGLLSCFPDRFETG